MSFECDKCDKSFSHLTNLSRHKKTAHPMKGDGTKKKALAKKSAKKKALVAKNRNEVVKYQSESEDDSGSEYESDGSIAHISTTEFHPSSAYASASATASASASVSTPDDQAAPKSHVLGSMFNVWRAITNQTYEKGLMRISLEDLCAIACRIFQCMGLPQQNTSLSTAFVQCLS